MLTKAVRIDTDANAEIQRNVELKDALKLDVIDKGPTIAAAPLIDTRIDNA